MNARTSHAQCPICDNDEVLRFFHLRGVPVFCNRLLESAEEASQAAVGELDLVFCPDCGHVWNQAFEPALVAYDPAYHNPLEVSERFTRYTADLAHRLIDLLELHGGVVVDVGCGEGFFLELICAESGSRGVGFDPAHNGPATVAGTGYEVSYISKSFGEVPDLIPADLVCCRQTLEHIAEPQQFVQNLRAQLCAKAPCGVFFEVPNSLFSFRDLGIWDLIYEHYSYFCPKSLRHLFQRAGFGASRVSEEYAGQFLGVYAGPNGETASGLGSKTPTVQEIVTFRRRFTGKLARWSARLAELRRTGRTAAVWGAGSKGTMFLNLTGAGEEVTVVVDVNPKKQGKFVAVTGHRIVAPSELVHNPPSEIIVMNRIYAEEIQALIDDLGLNCRMVFA